MLRHKYNELLSRFHSKSVEMQYEDNGETAKGCGTLRIIDISWLWQLYTLLYIVLDQSDIGVR